MTEERKPAALTKMGRALSSVIGWREFMLLCGLGALAYGLSLVWWPAAFIVPGAVATSVAIFGVR